ncbi:MAG: MBL fold metallo-hydrolase [Candidatus Lokiarchaeota archaeon]
MILERITVGALGTNCYIFGSKEQDTVIIDPGAQANKIIDVVEEFSGNPKAILLTHGHFDHSSKVGKLKRHFNIPLMYSKKEYDSGIFTLKKADKWLKDGDIIQVGNFTLKVLETPGHSPGSLCFYSKDVEGYNGNDVGGVIFTGDLLFRRSVGRTDINGGSQNQLFTSIKKKLMENPEITDNFAVFPGHMDPTTIGQERKLNMFRNYFS